MSIAHIVGAAVDAYQKYKSGQDALNWQLEVSSKLNEISDQLSAISSAILTLQETINQLPSEVNGLLLKVTAAQAAGWTNQAMDAAEAARIAGHVTPAQISALWDLVNELAAHEGAIEAGWAYSAYSETFRSFLARVGIYRVLFHSAEGQQDAARAAFAVAQSRKLAFLDAGIRDDENHNGPGRELEIRMSLIRFADPIFDQLERQERGLRIGWFEYNPSGNGLSSSGDPNNTHVKITQEKLVGTKQAGFSTPQGWGRDTLPLASPNPNWGTYFIDNPWWPARTLNNYGTAGFNDRCFGARNETITALNNAVRKHWIHVDTANKLENIVTDLRAIRQHTARLTIT